jgi:hypothetical protein
VQLDPRTARFAPTDERWLRQVDMLAQDLRKAGVLQRGPMPQNDAKEGVGQTKGYVSQIILSLGSAGTFTASAELLKSWLGRDRSRKIIVTFYENGRPQTIELSGDVADEDVFERIQSSLSD